MSDSPQTPETTAESTGGAPRSTLGLGTFLGVFTPTTLTILGVILYLRFGWVLGNAGLVGTLAIVLLANLITFMTGLSLSALATSMRVGVGGAYFLISRTLGLELGGALGIPLYLSQTLSVTLYAYGLAESMRIIWPDAPVPLLAGLIVVLVVLLASRSTVLALKVQLPVMFCIVASLVAVTVGVWGADFQVEMGPPSGEVPGFWVIFAVFFPAVTGILAGVGLSGDLRDPTKSIPKGVLWSIFIGLAVYMVMPFVLARAGDVEALRSDPLLWTKVAWGGAFLVLPGLWGAILSSAMGSILGAPRTLQALAADGLAPAALGRTEGETAEPLVALRISGGVALVAVLLGNLDTVAMVVSMFFLTTYGMLNLAACLEALVKDPAYRPKINVPWWVSFLGFIGCFVAMFAIHAGACMVALVFEVGIWWYLSKRTLQAAWGDLRTGLWFAMARFSMLQLRTARIDPRNWRPHLLVFSRGLSHDMGLVTLASNLSQDHGIVSVTTLVSGDVEDNPAMVALRLRNQQLVDSAGIRAFCEVACVSDVDSGMLTVAQVHGIGGIDSNMIMLGWPRVESGNLAWLLKQVRKLSGLQKSTMIVRPSPGSRARGNGEIVVWWKGKQHNGDLMLLLAHLLTMSSTWRGTRIVLKSVVEDEEAAAEVRAGFEAMLPDLRMEAGIEVIVRPSGQDVREVIRVHSAAADLIFLGMAEPPPGEEYAYSESLQAMLEGMPSAILVRNAGPFRGRLV